MALKKLSHLNDWHVSDRNEDVRGKVLYERDGDRVGKINDMLVDTDAKLVRTVILDNGERFSVDDIDITKDGVYLKTTHAGAHTGTHTGMHTDTHTGAHTEPRVKIYRGGESSSTRPRA